MIYEHGGGLVEYSTEREIHHPLQVLSPVEITQGADYYFVLVEPAGYPPETRVRVWGKDKSIKHEDGYRQGDEPRQDQIEDNASSVIIAMLEGPDIGMYYEFTYAGLGIEPQPHGSVGEVVWSQQMDFLRKVA